MEHKPAGNESPRRKQRGIKSELGRNARRKRRGIGPEEIKPDPQRCVMKLQEQFRISVWGKLHRRVAQQLD